MLQDPTSCYYKLVPDLINNVDTERIVSFGMNVGYNSCTIGAGKIREIESMSSFNILWSISLESSGNDYPQKSHSIHSLISQGRDLGVYNWLIFSLDNPIFILELAQNFPECAFSIFCPPEEITPALLDEASNIYNIMFVVEYGDDLEGCSITYGTALAVVTAAGMNTEMGKIANLLDNEEDSQTPLQKKLAQLGKYLGVLPLAACAIIFVVGLLNGIPTLEIFMTAVSLAVSAIPEGLPAIVTIVLSIGVQRMVSKNAIIRRLPAVETLGGASVICSDKTGTLTQNKMTLVKAYVDGRGNIEPINSQNTSEVKHLLQYAALCCDGSVVFHGIEEQHIGDPTETAIILAAHKNGLTKEELNQKYPRLGEIPFDSDRKLMTTIHKIDGKLIAIVKGAFDVMSSRCIKGDLTTAREINAVMSSNALRVIAIGYKELKTMPEEITPETLENNLTFLGLVGMIDPPRPEAKEAVAICRKAGVVHQSM